MELKKQQWKTGLYLIITMRGPINAYILVTPASGEAYLVARNITVTPREAETDGSNGGQEQETGDDEPEADPVLPTISRKMPRKLWKSRKKRRSQKKRKQKDFPMRKQRMEAIRLTSYREMNSILNWTTRTDVPDGGDGQLFPVISRREA
mgnify:CR=1 FL=1